MTTYTVEIQYPTEMACEGPETYTDEVTARFLKRIAT